MKRTDHHGPGDPLLDAAGRALRDADPLHDRGWDNLSLGTLTPEEAAALRARAERGEVHASSYEVLRPFEGAERKSLLAAVLAADRATATGHRPVRDAPVGQAPRRRRWFAIAAGGTAAAAAMIACFVVLRGPTRGPGDDATAVPLHHLTLASVGDNMREQPPLRDEPSVALRPGESLVAHLAAGAAPPASEATEVRVFAADDEEVRAVVTVPVPAGATAIEVGRISRSMLTGPTGRSARTLRLVFALGTPSAFHSEAATATRLGRMTPVPGIELLSRTVQLVER